MAVAFRAVGTRFKANSGGAKAIAMPAGVVAGDLLIMISTSDCRSTETIAAGWTYLMQAGRNDQTSATPWPKTRFYWKIATGGEGFSQLVTYSSSPYPLGSPNVLTYIAAYSGTHQTAPIVDWEPDDTTDDAKDELHPQLNITSASSWLLTVRSCSAAGGVTFTETIPGTDTERVDDTDGFAELSVALYDTAAGLSTGLAAQRTTRASGQPNYGSNMSSLAIRPPTSAGVTAAPADLVSVVATAYDATVQAVSAQDWATLCSQSAVSYKLGIDWSGNDDFTGVGENVTDDVLQGGASIAYGRDQNRQLSPTRIGSMSYTVNNSGRTYSPENVLSPMSGELDPAKKAMAEVTFSGTTYPLFRGRVDQFTIKPDVGDRTVDFTFLDHQAVLQTTKLSTPLYSSMRTGDLIGIILDAAGWTGGRDIDPGATVVPWWWGEGTDAFEAIQELVRSEGPPAVAYQSPDGTFVFRDRHHRILRTQSLGVQGSFGAAQIDCAAPAVTGLSYTAPFVYEHGWRDIVNSVSFDVTERSLDVALSDVWTYGNTLNLAIGESVVLDVAGSDPFQDAVAPVVGTDYTLAGAGTVLVTLSRTSGLSVQITLLAVGGSVSVTDLQLRARALPVRRTLKIGQRDADSISQHGTKEYPDSAPWASVQDAYAISTVLLAHYAQRRPMVQMRLVASTPEHFAQILSRTVSDRITITNGELGLSDDFFVETITHTITRIWTDRAPVHSVVLGCEKQLADQSVNPFTFDKRGAGFDDGVFDPQSSDDPSTVFIFDHPTQGQFDSGQFGT